MTGSPRSMTLPPPPSPAPHACYLYLIRHGATPNNLANPPKVQGQHANSELSEEGQAQAEATARWLANHPIRAVYSSPLTRAAQTAAAIAAAHGLQPQAVEAVREIDVGRWEGKTWAEVRRDDPEGHRRFLEDPAVHPYAGGENLTQLLARTAPAIESLLKQHLGELIVLVAHNVVNRSYLAQRMGLPLAKARAVTQANCGLNVIRYRDGEIKPVTINAHFHLATW